MQHDRIRWLGTWFLESKSMQLDGNHGVIPEPSKILLNGLQQHFFQENTTDKPVAVEGEPDARTVWLVVEQQSFRLAGYYDTKEEAIWMRQMLAKALAKLAK